MRYLGILLLVGFVTLAVFGTFGLHIGQSHGSGCLSATLSGADCPKQASLLGYVSFHIDALKVFSTAVFALTLFFILAGVAAVVGGLALARPSFAYSYLKKQKIFHSVFKRRFSHWLSLLENSPTSF